MKTTLVYVGSTLFLWSCVNTSNSNESENLPIEEMKAKVEAEEILFDKEKKDLVVRTEGKSIEKPEPIYRGCILPHGELGVTVVPKLPDVLGCPAPPDSEEPVFEIPQVEAQYPGGIVEMKKFINSNLEYPNVESDVQGTVYVSFVVEKDGSITQAEVMRGFEKEFNEEALRLVKSMPKWIPAQNNGKVVAAKVRLPIRFTLN